MIYTISNNLLTLTIDSKGAEIKSIRKDNIEYIHQDDPKTWNRSAPFLFPAIGCFKDKVTKFNGMEYKLPKHGFVRDMKTSLVSKTDSSLVFEVKENEESLSYYPFNFIYRVTYTLENNTVNVKIDVVNTNDIVLPFNLGLHPAFRVPLFEKEQFEDYTIYFNQKDNYTIPSIDLQSGLIDWNKPMHEFKDFDTLPLNYDDYKNDALVFDNVKFDEITLKNNDSGYGIKLSFNDFKTVGIWTPNHVNANFVCLEPWIGCADAPTSSGNFVDKKDVINLNPQETFSTTYKITILK